MNPFTSLGNVASEIKPTKLQVDYNATHERKLGTISGPYADYKLLKNSITSILISESSYEISISSTGNAGTWAPATNSNLKQLILENKSRLPCNPYATLETSFVQYESLTDPYDSTISPTLVHPSNKLFCTVIDDEFIVYMPPIKAFGVPNGSRTIDTYQFVSTDGINWTTRSFWIQIDNTNDPSLGILPDRWKAKEYNYSNIFLEGADQPHISTGSPFFYWFVKKLNGVYFLWIQENQYRAYNSPLYSGSHWHRCWTSVDGLSFTPLNSVSPTGYVSSFEKGPYSEECFQYFNGHLILASDPIYMQDGGVWKFFHRVGVSKDMGLTWTTTLRTGNASFVTNHSWNNENSILVFTEKYIEQFKFDSSQNVDLSQAWTKDYRRKSSPNTVLNFVDNFRNVYRHGNYVAIDSGSTTYFCELNTLYNTSGALLVASFPFGVQYVLGFSSSGTHMILRGYDESVQYYEVSYAYTVLTSTYNYLSDTYAYIDKSIVDPLSNNNWSVTAHHYDGSKLTLVSYKTVRETTDGVTYTVKPTPSNIANRFQYENNNTSLMRTTNLYDTNYYYIDSSGFKWTINEDFTVASKSLNSLGGLPYPSSAKYNTYHNNIEKFLMIVDTSYVTITVIDAFYKNFYATKNLYAYSPYNDSIQKIILPEYINKIVSDGIYTYASVVNTNKIYKIWFDLTLNAFQRQDITVSNNQSFLVRDVVCYTKNNVNTILVLGTYGTGSIVEIASLAFSIDGGSTFSEYKLAYTHYDGQPITFGYQGTKNTTNCIAIDTENNLMYLEWGVFNLTPQLQSDGTEKIVWFEAWKNAYNTRELTYSYGITSYGRANPSSPSQFVFNNSKKIVRIVHSNIVSSDLKG